MTKPMIRIHDISTDEIIDREMTPAEYKQHQAHVAEIAALQSEAEAKAIAREAVLDRLGLTAEEAKLLLS